MLGASGFSLAFWCQVTPTFDALSAILSQACKCNMCQQLHGTHTYIFLFILGTCTAKDFSSSCCNAACQFGSPANRGTRPLPFPHPFKCSILAHVSTSVLRCKEACGTEVTCCHIRWTSRSRDSTSRGIAQAAHTWPIGTHAHGLAS